MKLSGPWSDEEFGGLLQQSSAYYTDRLRHKGTGPEGMDWRDRASQHLRFERLLAQLEPASDASLLDVGCGSGELLSFCHELGWRPAYLGIDVSEEMVAACNRRFGPGTAETTTLADLARQGRQFDLVLASGTFNVRQTAPEALWRRFFHRSVVEMFALSRVAVAFNVMSSRVDYRYDHLYYAGVEEIAELADRCATHNFVIDHGYPLFEVTGTLVTEPAHGP